MKPRKDEKHERKLLEVERKTREEWERIEAKKERKDRAEHAEGGSIATGRIPRIGREYQE